MDGLQIFKYYLLIYLFCQDASTDMPLDLIGSLTELDLWQTFEV